VHPERLPRTIRRVVLLVFNIRSLPGPVVSSATMMQQSMLIIGKTERRDVRGFKASDKHRPLTFVQSKVIEKLRFA
jgi:hypothetical protein